MEKFETDLAEQTERDLLRASDILAYYATGKLDRETAWWAMAEIFKCMSHFPKSRNQSWTIDV